MQSLICVAGSQPSCVILRRLSDGTRFRVSDSYTYPTSSKRRGAPMNPTSRILCVEADPRFLRRGAPFSSFRATTLPQRRYR